MQVQITFNAEVISEEEWQVAKKEGVSSYKLDNGLALFHITQHDCYFYNKCFYFVRYDKTGNWEYSKLS